MSYDPYEFYRLQDENEYLYEQVRTLSAELHKQDRTKYIITRNGSPLRRPAHVTAASRMLLTDEMVEQSRTDVIGHAAVRLHRHIGKQAFDEGRKPLDHMWRLTMERDFRD